MSHGAVDKPAVIIGARFGWAAVLVSLTLGCTMTVTHLYHTKSVPQAISDGAAAAVTGFVSWTVYHAISRRNNGLGLVMLGMFAGMPVDSNRSFFTAVSIGLVGGVPVGVFVGVVIRWLSIGKRPPRSADPMYDAEADRSVANEGPHV